VSEWKPGTKNAHGVYCPHEVLELRYKVGGVPRAEIALVQTRKGWRSKCGFSFRSGDWWGSFGPITNHCTPYPTREDAIREQVNRMHNEFAKIKDTGQQREAREILAWADSLLPAQRDLFAA
jgi:hypothetical protein